MPNRPLKDLFQDPEFVDVLTTVLLPTYLPRQRWFTSKGKNITDCSYSAYYGVLDDAGIAIVSVDFADGSQETYQLPLSLNRGEELRAFYQKNHPGLILGEITGTGLLADAIPRGDFRAKLYEIMYNSGEQEDGLSGEAGTALKGESATATSTVPAIDTSNTAIVYNDRFFFKLFRKLGHGLNPDLELARFLSEATNFDYSPPYGGSLGVGSIDDHDGYLNLGMMSVKVDNRGDAWELFQKLTERYFAGDGPVDKETLDRARLLGVRTAQMHKGLASANEDRAELVPEPMGSEYRREITEADRKSVV